MSTFVLKIIAIVTMLIDHLTATFVPQKTVLYFIGRSVGRIAFPLFCFMLVQGAFYTRNIWKYLLRVGLLAVISEVPFDMMHFGKYMDWGYQNVVVTLFLGLLAITLIDMIKNMFYPTRIWAYTIITSSIILAAGFAGQFFLTDYGMFGVALIIVMYFTRTNRVLMMLAFGGLVLLGYGFRSTELFGLVAFAFIIPYNGKKGPDDKKLFYLFYPVHALVIGALQMFVFV